MMDGSGLSVADALALSRNNGNGSGDGMWGDGGYWFIFLFFLLAWGNNGWGGGFGGNGGGSAMQGALTRGDLCMDMSFNDVQNGVRNVTDAVNTGFANLNATICHQQYDTAALINGLGNTIQSDINAMNIANLQSANAQNIAALQNANAIQTQIAQCCCENREGQAQINYNMAQNTCALQNTMNNNTRDIIQTQEAGTRAILDYLCQDKISTLQNENQALRLAASQQAQNNYLISELKMPTPVPAYITCSPYASAFGFGGYGYNGYSNGCGCGCGCNN